MAKIKVAVVIRNYHTLGGGENFAVQTCERMARHADYDIHVLANNWQRYSDAVTFHTIPTFPLRMLKQWHFARQVAKRVRQLQPDVIHTHERILQADAYTMHATSHLYWKLKVQGKSVPSLFDYLQHRLEKRMLNHPRCRILMPVSSLIMESYDTRHFALGDKHTLVIPPGVGQPRITERERSRLRTVFRVARGFHDEDKLILFVGMNFAHKGLARLIDALTAPELRSARLLVVGRGDPSPYIRSARRQGVHGRLDFLGVQSEMREIYAACDVLALPSRFETFGMVAIEAVAAGTPAVISKWVGAKDILRNPQTIVDDSRQSLIRALSLALFDCAALPPQPRLPTWDETAAAIMDAYTRKLSKPAKLLNNAP